MCVWEYYSVFVKQPDCLLLISSLRYTLDANRIFRMAAAVVGTAVGLYTVVNQDTNHGAEHHPLGAQKTGTGSTIGEENKQDEPEEETKDESKEESKDESKEEPKSDQQDPSKPTKENSEEKDTQSPDQSDKVSIAAG